MTDHLPECQRWFTDMPTSDECPACEMLRACEQRLTEGWCKAVCANSNYEAGLDDAWEAVAAAPGAYSGYPLVERVKALAAIDALRGQQK